MLRWESMALCVRGAHNHSDTMRPHRGVFSHDHAHALITSPRLATPLCPLVRNRSRSHSSHRDHLTLPECIISALDTAFVLMPSPPYSLSVHRPDHPGGRDLQQRRLRNHFELHVHGQLCGNTSHITLCCICKSGCSSRLQNGGCCVLLNRWWPVDWCSRLITQS